MDRVNDSSDGYDAQEAWNGVQKRTVSVSRPEHWTRTLSPNKVRKEGGVGDQPVGAYVPAPKAPEASFSTTLKNPPLENVATTEFARKYAKEEACNRKFTKFPIPPFSMIKTSTRGGMHG